MGRKVHDMLRGMNFNRQQCEVLIIGSILGVLAGVLGCGASSSSVVSQPHDERSTPTQPEKPVTEPPPRDLRSLGAEATFKDLVSAADLLDQRALDSSPERCLLQNRLGAKDPWTLKADLAVAVRPLPEPPAELATRLRDPSTPVTLLSRWGRIGDNPAALVLAAFTTTSTMGPNTRMFALLLTKEGAFFRSLGNSGDAMPTGPLQPDNLVPLLAERIAQSQIVLCVTAEAQIPVSALYKVLASLPSKGIEVVLAAALPAETSLPALSVSPTTAAGLWCPSGLPDPAPSSTEGELPQQTILGALAPIRDEAQACFVRSAGGATAGGKVKLAVRIGADGRVQATCLLEDEIRDSTLAQCLLDAARQIVFPKPSPAGFVDVSVPLRLTPAIVPPQNPICD